MKEKNECRLKPVIQSNARCQRTEMFWSIISMLLFEVRRSEHSFRSSVNSWFYTSALDSLSSWSMHPADGPENAASKKIAASAINHRVLPYLLLHRAHDALQHHLNAHLGRLRHSRRHDFSINRLNTKDDNERMAEECCQIFVKSCANSHELR